MHHTIDHFINPQGQHIHTESWLPSTPARAAILVVHGYAEHIGRYTHVAEALASAGYAIYGLDHRGHGRSTGVRAHFRHLDEPVNDLIIYYHRIRRAQPDLPIIVLGHSMGTLISLTFTLRLQDQLAGLILSGTAINGDETVTLPLQILGTVLRPIVPLLRLVPGQGTEALTTDPVMVEAARTDPLSDHGMWRVGMGTLLLQTGRKLRKRLPELTLPLLLLHGEDDTITPVSGARAIYSQANSADKTLLLYPGMRHEVMNELERQRVLEEIISWLHARY